MSNMTQFCISALFQKQEFSKGEWITPSPSNPSSGRDQLKLALSQLKFPGYAPERFLILVPTDPSGIEMVLRDKVGLLGLLHREENKMCKMHLVNSKLNISFREWKQFH